MGYSGNTKSEKSEKWLLGNLEIRVILITQKVKSLKSNFTGIVGKSEGAGYSDITHLIWSYVYILSLTIDKIISTSISQ